MGRAGSPGGPGGKQGDGHTTGGGTMMKGSWQFRVALSSGKSIWPNGNRRLALFSICTVRVPMTCETPESSVTRTEMTWIPSRNRVVSTFATNPEKSANGTSGNAAATSGRVDPYE